MSPTPTKQTPRRTPDRPVNFSPGPAILPISVMEQASRDIVSMDATGLSILEISHRSATFERILYGTRDAIRRLLHVPETHDILFLQGGARGQFAMAPVNFLRPGDSAQYVVSGYWSEAALAEARHVGAADAVASSEDQGYAVLPDLADAVLPYGTTFVHTTSNNTLYGTQWHEMPEFGDVPHLSDMSSDIFSRPIDVGRFGLIYAGAQKNAGAAGVTLAIIDREWMAQGRDDIPLIHRYTTHAAKDSMYNTPPVFAIHVMGLVMGWLEAAGGVEEMARRALGKAYLVYDVLDSSDGFYIPRVAGRMHRSRMNITWRIRDDELQERFLFEAAEVGLVGLKGHRRVGGLRASLYNAMPRAGVERLAAFLEQFAARHA